MKKVMNSDYTGGGSRHPLTVKKYYESHEQKLNDRANSNMISKRDVKKLRRDRRQLFEYSLTMKVLYLDPTLPSFHL